MSDEKTLDVAWPTLVLKVAWIVLRLALVLALAERGRYFFYQGF